WPYTCMEAMAHAKVVVGFDAGGVGEMLADGAGILCPITDDLPRSLAAGLDRAASLSGSEREAMGRRARTRLESLCDNTRVASARVEWYRTIAKRRRSPLRRVLRRIH
ncbi:MAG: hypothetical protein KDA28_04590, partial [Phycisphaerales bacterium]|nr:hypothetical protein [Phycisphaerales bacterium]